MAKPDFAFRTDSHTVFSEGDGRWYRAEPGGHKISLTLTDQNIPAEILSLALERGVGAWVMARGGRTLNLNGRQRDMAPEWLDRPPKTPARRIVSIAPSNAEIMGALDAVGLLVGVESSSDYPLEVQKLPRLGSDLNVDMEALAALEPDLVLASLSVPGMERNITALHRLGIPIIVLAPRNLADIHADILRVGRAVGRSVIAEQLVREMALREQAFISRLAESNRSEQPVRVYLEWWPKPMFSPGATCWSNELIRLSGGENVFRHLPGQSGEVTQAQVVEADPEVIFIAWCGVPKEKLNPAHVLSRDGLAEVSAVRDGRVFMVDEALLGRPGPRVLEGVSCMAEAIQQMEMAKVGGPE